MRKVIGRRQHVTVLFSDVSGSSEHAERLEAEEYAELLDRFRHFARDIIPRHGGSIARLQGDGVLALFGFAESREDDGRRATESALELHSSVATLHVGRGAHATQMMLHSGIHAGLVLLIEGDIERGRFDVVGEVPNTASRLCSLAKAGEILVSEESLGPQAHFFAVSDAQRFPIRGRSLPVNALRIQGRAAIERRIDAAARRGLVPFVGRASTLHTLLAAAQSAQNGSPAALMLCGEPGIGKTRLITEFSGHLDPRSFHVVQGYCESYSGAEPLQPFLQMVRSNFDWPPGQTTEVNRATAVFEARAAPPAHGTEHTGEDEKLQWLNIVRGGPGALDVPGAPVAVPSASKRRSAIVSLLSLLAVQRTLVVVLDDWQWADDASRQVLDALLAQKLPLFILLASRTVADEQHLLSGIANLRLQPLAASEAERAIAAWLPDSSPFLLQEIFQQSGGSPLFIEELCHAAAAGGELRASAHGTGVAWINALVASRLARLQLAQAECLGVSSVLGTVFELSQLEHLMQTVDITPTIETLTAQDFLISGNQPGQLKFKHALTRDAVYATLEPLRRQALHARIAQLLLGSSNASDAPDEPDGTAPLEALSYHFDAAGQDEQAATYGEAAGDKALGAMALDRARLQYITALTAMDNLPALDDAMKLRWCGIAQKLGQTCVFDPLDIAYSFALFERAAKLARETGSESAIARAEYWLGYVNYGRGRPRSAVRHSERALAHAMACDDQKLVAQVQATLGQSLASAGRYEQAMPLLDFAVQSKRQFSRPGSGVAIGSAYTLARKAYTLGDLGQFSAAYDCFSESLALLGDGLQPVGASVRELMCAVYLWQGRWEEAYAIGMEGSDIAMRCRSRYLHAMGRALAACGAWAHKGDGASLQMLRESTQWIEVRGGAVSISLNYGWLVQATASEGLYAEARQHAARLFTRARGQDRHGEAMGCRALAKWATARGAFDRAMHYLQQADRAAEFRGSARERAVNLLARAELAYAKADRLAGQSLAEASAEAFAQMDMAWFKSRADALLGT